MCTSPGSPAPRNPGGAILPPQARSSHPRRWRRFQEWGESALSLARRAGRVLDRGAGPRDGPRLGEYHLIMGQARTQPHSRWTNPHPPDSCGGRSTPLSIDVPNLTQRPVWFPFSLSPLLVSTYVVWAGCPNFGEMEMQKGPIWKNGHFCASPTHRRNGDA